MMTTLQQFLMMNGYGFFIWCAYGFAFLVLALNVFIALKHWKMLKKNIKQ